MTIGKYLNPKYADEGYANNVPVLDGDDYFGQDLMRDFRYQQDITGNVLSDLEAQVPCLLSGGIVTQGSGLTLDITAGYGYAKFNTDVVDSYTGGLPPTVTTAYLSAIRLIWAQQTNLNGATSKVADYTVVNDGATPNYVKVRYLETDGQTRARAHLAGTISCEVTPDIVFYINSTAPSANNNELCLASFISNGATYTITSPYVAHTLTYPTISALSSRLASFYDAAMTSKAQITRNNGGFWGEIYWKDATHVYVYPKTHSGYSWVGAILNDGTYLELTSTYTINTALTGDGGLLDGVGSIKNSTFYVIWAYKGAGGALQFGLTYMPNTTLAAGSPTTSLTVATPLGLGFPVGAQIALFQSATQWETILAYQNGAAPVPTFMNAPATVASHAATTIGLNGTLNVTNFPNTTTQVYQIGNFMPIDQTTGAVSATIGARGYLDTGIRVRTDAAGNIYNFMIDGNEFCYINGTGAADSDGYGSYSDTSSFSVYRLTYCPPDKAPILYIDTPAFLAYSMGISTAAYWATYGGTSSRISYTSRYMLTNTKSRHGLFQEKYLAGAANTIYTRGYLLK
jgi:hypothetical protein